MSIQTLHDTGASYQVLSKYDGGVYDLAVGGDYVIAGVGDEFTLNYSGSSLDVSILAGSEAVIGGSFFKVTANETVTLTANTTIYFCARIDLSKANGSRGSFESLTQAQMQSDNLNGTGTKRDMLLYIITTNGSGVTNVTDSRSYKSSGATISSGTSLPGSANEGDIFLLYEV